MTPISVFIQYAHVDDDYRRKALDLADKLRDDGLDATIDWYEPHPPEGFPTWMSNQLRSANFVLVLCSHENLTRFRKQEPPPKGRGATWEGNLIQQELYNAGVINRKFIPVILREEDKTFIPEPLDAVAHYHVFEASGYEALYRRLTDQPDVTRRPLGSLKRLPPKPR